MEYISAKSILSKVGYDNSKWFGIDYNMNLYKGCCHGCIYCDSRSDCYRIENFDKVRLKENAIDILNKELKGKRQRGVVGIGAMSDTYNPFEEQNKITRQALKLVANYGFGVSIDTKSNLIVRDIDILKNISNKYSTILKLTITTADDNISSIIEPNVCVSSKRFEAIKALSEEGLYAGILFTPILPFITDTMDNVKQMVKKAHENGAKFIYPMFGVTLRGNQRDYFYEKLDILFPELTKKYQRIYGENYVCSSIYSKELYRIFKEECNRYKILYKMDDIIKGYKKDTKVIEQMSMF